MGFVDLPIATWLMLNSPVPPRRFMKMGMGVLAGIHKLASALMLLPNPLDCMKTAAFGLQHRIQQRCRWPPLLLYMKQDEKMGQPL